MIKHIFSDMDGTILNDAGDITDNNVQIIKQTNIPFTLVSARAPMEMDAVMTKLNLTTPQVGFNGGLIFQKLNDQIKVLSAVPIEISTAKKVYNAIRTKFNAVSLSWYSLSNWYSERVDRGTVYEEDYTSRGPTIMNFAEFSKNKNKQIFKFMMIIFDSETMKNVKTFLKELNLPGINIQQSSNMYLEISSERANKARGINYIIQEEKLQSNELMAFGDGHNDLPMLKMVDYPVVMKNALPDVLEVAKYVTKSNEEDGVGYALQHYLPTI